MYNNTKVIQAIKTLAGLRQTDNPDFPQLASDLLYTGDNVLIQHSLINIENIDMAARNYAKYVYPAYTAGANYGIGAKVRYTIDNDVYEAKVPIVNAPPVLVPADWDAVNHLSEYLEDVFSNAAEDTVNDVFTAKKLAGQTKTIMSQQRLYEGVGNMNELVVNEGCLVGVQVQVLNRQNLAVIIERIGFQFTQANTPIRLYLFHSSQQTAVATIDLNHIKLYSFQWHELKWKLSYLYEDLDAGGVFFIMYDQATLVGQAIKKRHNFHLAPCGYCSNYDTNTWKTYSKYVYMRSVAVRPADRNGVDLWDITKTQYTPDNNYGINFDLTVRCDLTDFIVQQKDVFQYAFRDMVTKKLLEMMSNSTRQNGNQEKLSVMARAELQAPITGGMGFMKQLNDQLKAVDFEISALDNTCMPCNKKSGLSYGTAVTGR